MYSSIPKRSLKTARYEIGAVPNIRKKNRPYFKDTSREARIETCNPMIHDRTCSSASFAILALSLLLLTVSSVGCLFHDALAQTSLFPGDTTRGLSSSIGNDQSANVVENQTSGLSMYTNAEYGFQLEFPSDWEVLPESSITSLPMEGIPNTVASIRSPADQGIHDLVTISVQTPSQYLDTDEMVVKTSNLSPQEHARIVTNLLPEHGFKLVREKAITVSGLPAWRIEYTTYNYDTEVFVVKADGTMYKIEFGTPMLKAPESLPVFDKMVESFKFVNSSVISQSQTSQNLTSGLTDSENDTSTDITRLATLPLAPIANPTTGDNEDENNDDGVEQDIDRGGENDEDDEDDKDDEDEN